MTVCKEDQDTEQKMDENREEEEKKDICRKMGRGKDKEVEVDCK
jgi:hypothetical protein